MAEAVGVAADILQPKFYNYADIQLLIVRRTLTKSGYRNRCPGLNFQRRLRQAPLGTRGAAKDAASSVCAGAHFNNLNSLTNCQTRSDRSRRAKGSIRKGAVSNRKPAALGTLSLESPFKL